MFPVACLESLLEAFPFGPVMRAGESEVSSAPLAEADALGNETMPTPRRSRSKHIEPSELRRSSRLWAPTNAMVRS